MKSSEATRGLTRAIRRWPLTSAGAALAGVLIGVAPLAAQFAPAQPTVPTATRPAAVAPQPHPTPGVPTTQPMPPSGQYRCAEPIHNFGEVWSGEDVNAEFIINNDADTPLFIPVAQPGCGCTVAEWDREIPPKGKGKVKATVRTKGLYPTEVTKPITLKTSDPKNASPVLQIKGKIKARVQMDPPSLAFGTIGKNSELTKKVTITNNTAEPLKMEKVPTLQGQPFTAELKAVEEGKKYELTVTLDKAKLRDGMNYGQVNLKTGLATDPDIYVTINAMKPPLVEVTPTSIIALATPTDAAMTKDLNINYNGEGTMQFQGPPICSDPKLTATITELRPATNPAGTPATPGPGRNFRLSVNIPAGYDPPVPATQPTTITLKTDLAEKPMVEIKVQTFPKRPAVPQVVPETLVGKPAPTQAITDLGGAPFTVGRTNGRITVLTFWASWCPHCKKLLPVLQTLSQTYSSKGVDFQLVSLDQTATAAQVQKIAKDLSVTLPCGYDPKQLSGLRYGANSFPITFVLNKTGTIEAVDRGSGAGDDLKTQLDALLAGKPLPKPVAQNVPATRPVAQVPPNQPNPTLVIDNPAQDIGKHKPGATGQYNVVLRNGGAQPLNITNVTGSEGLKINPQYTRQIPPGGSGSILCEFTAPNNPGAFTNRLTIATNDPAKPQFEVTLKGTASGYLELEPITGVDFGKKPATFDMQRMATIKYNGQGSVNFLSAESDSPQFFATVKPVPQNPTTAMLLVSAKPPFDLGEHKAKITVKTDCKEQPTIEVPVTLFQPPRIDITPAVVAVPKIQRIQSSTVTITNNGSTSLSILSLKCTTDKVRWQFWPDTDGKSYRLNLTIVPGFSASPDGEKLTIKTDDAEFGEIVIPIKTADAAVDASKGISRLP